MSRRPLPLLWLALTFALAGGGCQPRDPLAWKIQASTPADFDLWQDRYQSRLPAKLRGEFTHAMMFLASGAGVGVGSRSAADFNRRLCQRIDGRTVRAIMIDAYHVERRFLLNRTILETDNIVRNVNASDALTGRPEKLEQFEGVRNRQQFNLEVMKERLAAIDERLRELESPAR